jgi:hypothetical protein
MAPGYGQYNNYYDPVGSQANQPQPYSYQAASTSASQPTTASYSAPSYPSYGSSAYSTQQHGTSASGQENQPSASRSASAQQNDGGSGSWGNPNYTSSSYAPSLQPPARSQANNSPLYASTAPSASYGRMNYVTPSSQAQSSTTTYGHSNYAQQSAAQSYSAAGTSDTSRQTYGTSQQNTAPTEPSRYASSLQPVQTQAQNHQPHHQSHQQTHARQPSRSSVQQPSPVMTRAPQQQSDHRQTSSSVEPTNTTVDPSQVYDFRAERERKAKIEAEKRRKMEEAEAARKAEEARVAEEQRKVDEAIRQAEEAKRKAEEQKANEERRRAEQARRKIEEQAAALKAAAKAEEKRKKEEQRKARESKNAANTLAAMASSSTAVDPNDLPPAANDEEAEMRAMFQKMREFNSKNPAMLAKLWEEERRSHAVQSQSPQPSPAPQTTVNPPKPKSNAPRQSLPSAQTPKSTSTPNRKKSAQKAATTMAGPANQGQSSEANVSQGTTHLWPPGKKGLLAEIAARWLQNANPQQPVLTAEVLKRLDMNPNYVQLCESLEAMGLKFERAAFARELLRGIPPGSNSSQPLTKVSDATIMSANGTVAQATGVPQPDEANPKKRRATKAEMEQRRALDLVKTINKQNGGTGSSNGMVEYQMPSFSVPGDVQNGGYLAHMPEQVQASASPFQPQHASPAFPTGDDYTRQPSQSVQPDRGSMSVPQQGRPLPVGSAQQTPEVRQMSPPRQPANKEEAARKRGFADLVDLTAGDSDDDAPPMKIMKPSQAQRPNGQQMHQPPPPQQQQQNQQPPYQYKPKPANFELLGENFKIKPFLKTPGVPTAPQLYMQSNGGFGPAASAPMAPGIASASAVPTPKPSHKKKGPTNESLQVERIRGKMVVEPIMRDRVARRSTYDSRTIARDILLATGRHPDMRPLNSHLNVMQKLLGERGGQLDLSGNKSDLATIKWDILDPDPPKRAKVASVVRSTEVDGEDADDEEDGMSAQKLHDTDHVQTAPDRSVHKSAPLPPSNANTNINTNTNTPDNKQPKKRGRPRKLYTDTTQNTPMSATGTPRQASTPATAPAGRSTAANVPTGTPVGYAAFKKLDANGNVIKTKGRPVGWRKNVHSREAQGLTPAKSQSSTKAKASAPRPEQQLQEPKYQVYKCRWTDCDAQLHSLDVLKKHVLKVHGKSNEENQYPCLWRGCADKDETFEDIPAWLGHVDKEHLQPVAWKLGDGPRGGLSG